MQLFCNLFDRPLHEFFANNFDLRFSPSAVIDLTFDPILDNESPARILGSATVALKPNYKLFEFIPG